MHKQILVEIYNPASNQTYDVFITTTSKVYEVTTLLSNAISELSQGRYKATEQSVLCDRNTGEILGLEKTIDELGFQNGAKMMLL